MPARDVVVFDCGDTLLDLRPARERIVQEALAGLGIRCALDTIRTAYRLVEFSLRQRSSRERTAAQKAAFFTRYNAALATALGWEAKSGEIDRLLQAAFAARRHWRPAEGVEAALQSIGARYRMFVMANWSTSLGEVLAHAGIADHFAAAFSSQELGSEKPLASAFRAFAERAGVALEDCYFVGNEYLADVVGSRAVGMTPLLLDRPLHYPDGADCPVFRRWDEVADHLLAQ